MEQLYQIGIHIYAILLRIASLVHPKARAFVNGRRKHKVDIKKGQVDVVWIHCASVGEYEQAKPLISQFKNLSPKWYIFLSFFSPSGFEHFDDSNQVDAVSYLPLDTKNNVRRFLDQLQPDLALFIKSEFWLNYLNELNQRAIPSFAISSVFRQDSYLFKPYGAFMLKALRRLTGILVQDQRSVYLLKNKGFDNVHRIGDTRMIQVLKTKQTPKDFKPLEQIIGQRICFIAGSTWPKDEQMLMRWRKAHPEDVLILAPHEWDSKRIHRLKKQFGPNAISYSELKKSPNTTIRSIILDQMGLLKYIYRLADISYIGGGFNRGIHNILEPTVYGIPVIFGPKYSKFIEAVDMVNAQVAYPIQNAEELHTAYVQFATKTEKLKCKTHLDAYFSNKASISNGAVPLILDLIANKRSRHSS